MRYRFLFMGLLSLPLVLAMVSCEKKENPKTIHFGPNPGDGQDDDDKDDQMNEMHFGPNPGDGVSTEDKVE